MNEKWLPVLDYEGIYSVSNFGRIRRDKKGKGTHQDRILKSWITDGYCCIELYKEGKAKGFKAHVLVALSFLGKAKEGEEVNHKNFNRQDNRLENLEWVTRKENIRHCVSAGRFRKIFGEKNPLAKLNNRKVALIRNLYSSGKFSHKKLGLMFNVTKTNIGYIVNNKTWVSRSVADVETALSTTQG